VMTSSVGNLLPGLADCDNESGLLALTITEKDFSNGKISRISSFEFFILFIKCFCFSRFYKDL
jgi:hypothetical protein